MQISRWVLDYVLFPASKAVAVILVMSVMAGILTLIERRLLGFLQIRKGPNRVGWQGSLQWLADAFKLMVKEDIVPLRAERFLHWLAPFLTLVPAITVFAVLPWGPEMKFPVPGYGWVATPLYASDPNVGVLLVLAVTSIGIYGIILGGWASNSKYALLGGLRSAAQLISYEVPMGFAVVSAILMGRSLSLVEIIQAQKDAGLWFVFPGLISFFLYFVSGVAETNRTPFDLPEAESELVAGFHTEYSGFKWSVFFMAEYANMITVGAIATTLFLGGWLRPFPNVAWLGFLDVVPPFAWFCGKVAFFLFSYIWFRATFPRYRFDQLMALGWKILIPISLGNVALVAAAALWGVPGLKVLGTVLTVLFAGLLVYATRIRPAKPRVTTTMGAGAETDVPAEARA